MGAKAFNPATDIPSLEGKVVLVTGGNVGLGKQTIAYLVASKPSRIYMGARTASKANAAIADLQKSCPNVPIEHLPLDLTSFASIGSAAKQFQSRESRLDLLINNAGVMALPYSLTEEGYEIQFGTNHIGHALLTKLLMPTLLSTSKLPNADVRIINVSSLGHMMAPSGGIIYDQAKLGKISTWRCYGQSKLANILFSKELATRYPEITSVSLHPGIILTDLYSTAGSGWFMSGIFKVLGVLAPYLPGHFKDPKGGALTQTWAAVVPKEKLVNGGYYTPVGVLNGLGGGSSYTKDKGLAKKLWEWTEEEFGKHGY